jgi:hypothetical protein
MGWEARFKAERAEERALTTMRKLSDAYLAKKAKLLNKRGLDQLVAKGKQATGSSTKA